MSLLLEALKKAEMAKRKTAAPSQPESEPQLELETPEAIGEAASTPAAATPSVGIELPFPEISLAELEPPETAAPQPEPVPAESSAAPDATPNKAEPAQEPVEPTLSLNLEIENTVEPGLSLDLPDATPQTPDRILAPQAIEETTSASISLQPDLQIVTSTQLSTNQPEPAPATAVPPLTAIPPPTVAVPEYAPTQPASVEPAPLSQNQETAKKILAAKLGPRRNLKLLGGILIGSMTVGAMAAYYYWQVASQPRIAARPPAMAPQPQPQPQPLPQTPPPQAAATARTPPPAETAAAAPHPPAPPAKPAAPVKPADRDHAGEILFTVEKPLKQKTVPAEGRDKPLAKAPDDASGGIRIRRDGADARLDPLLASAYQAFMAGDSGKAEVDYRKALQQTPNNRDALLGLAAIAATRGKADEAASHYLRLLQLDPRDAAAQAGLIGLKGYSDPTLSESRLKGLLAQSPDTGYLHFALGNLYAQQSRWPEAQESYFNALHAEPGNADYAFNLAVALEHLDQRKPALVYYQRALSLAKERSAGFDKDQLKNRIHELQAD